jgi:aspartyl-tRNA(Asn)/glutamyl-tRNA(Gln) amidotransferase subunit A
MKTISQIHEELISKKKTVRNIVDEYLHIIMNHEKRVNINLEDEKDINAILGLFDKSKIDQQIDIAQKMIDMGNANIFTGIPVILKDNILMDDEIFSSGSKMLENYKATYDSSLVKKLKDAGAVMIARANMDEFAMGSSGENSAYNATKNPIDISRVPGGSSSGPAASVCYGAAPISFGSDTGGSVRIPADFCGIVGYKPSYGSISRYGLMAMGSSLDQIGPFTNNVEDSEFAFDLLSFYDSNDATSISQEVRDKNNKDINFKKKIGIPTFLKNKELIAGVDENKLKDFYIAVEKLKENGYDVIDVELKDVEKALAIYYIICPAEVSSNLGRYDGVRYGLRVAGENTVENFINSRTAGFGDEVRRRIMTGTYILSAGYFDAYYNKAVAAREILKKEFEKVFKDVDAIITPVAPTYPWKIGEKNDPLSVYMTDIFAVPANMIGSPSISIPIKKRAEVNENNLPAGIQILAEIYKDKKLFAIAKDIEKILQK